LPKNLSLALGTPSVTLLEMVRAFGVFAAGGNLAEPLFILKVTDRNGNVLEEDEPSIKPALSPETAYIMTDMLKNVVQSGTARSAAKLGKNIAGKTGTTSDYRDNWFIGYNPQLVAGVWVGYDDHRSIGDKETGASTALPIWMSFMTEASRGKEDEEFPVPEGISWMDVNLRERYPMPVFESSPVARIPYVPGASAPAPVPAKASPEKPLDAVKVEPADLTGISADQQPSRASW